MSGVKCGVRGSVAGIDRPYMHVMLRVFVRGGNRICLSVILLLFLLDTAMASLPIFLPMLSVCPSVCDNHDSYSKKRDRVKESCFIGSALIGNEAGVGIWERQVTGRRSGRGRGTEPRAAHRPKKGRHSRRCWRSEQRLRSRPQRRLQQCPLPRPRPRAPPATLAKNGWCTARRTRATCPQPAGSCSTEMLRRTSLEGRTWPGGATQGNS